MRKLIGLVVIGAALAGAGIVNAQTNIAFGPQSLLPGGPNRFSIGGTNIGTTNAYAIVPVGDGSPVITFINANSDVAAATVQFWMPKVGLTVSNSSVAANSCVVLNTNNTAAQTTFIARHISATNTPADDVYERLTLSTSVTNLITFVTTSVAPWNAGDILYPLKKSGAIVIQASTNQTSGECVFGGINGQPILVDLNGTTTEAINLVSGKYQK